MDRLERDRKILDEIDDKLIHLLHLRFKVIKDIGKIKKELHYPIFDKNRWKKVIEQRKLWARERDVNENLVEKLFDLIHEEAQDIEKKIQ